MLTHRECSLQVPKSAAGVSRMKAMGIVQTERKYGAGGNASAHAASVNARKIEESDELKHNKVRKTLLTPSVCG